MRKTHVLSAMLLVAAGAFSSPAPTPKPLSIVKPSLRQYEGGPPVESGFHTGDTVFFSFQIAGYQVSPEARIDLAVRVEVFDPAGAPLVKPIEHPIATQVSAEDKNWLPVVREAVEIPPLALPGIYRIRAAVEDRLSKQSAASETAVPVRGTQVEPSDTLVARNFRFLRSEDDRNPLASPVYRSGDAVWVRFEMTGFRYGEKNRVAVSYGVTILGPSGNQMYSQPQAALDEDAGSFYPKRYLPGVFNLSLSGKVQPGEYALLLTLRDLAGNQTDESRHVFRVE
ncbi:MAG TPA: hypothetical protein VF767_04790 [Bryobacteraceae bacterium]